jgi:hypothetical protein
MCIAVLGSFLFIDSHLLRLTSETLALGGRPTTLPRTSRAEPVAEPFKPKELTPARTVRRNSQENVTSLLVIRRVCK